MTTAEARAGFADARGYLVSEVVDGATLWRGATTDGARHRDASPRVHLLPAFDEYLVAYRDRRAVLDETHASRVNAGGGMLKPCVVVNGRVAGSWQRALGRRTVDVEVELFEPLSKAVRRGVATAASRYGAFLALEARVVDGICSGQPGAKGRKTR